MTAGRGRRTSSLRRERATSVAPRRSITGWAAASACNSRTQKGHQAPQKKLTTTGPRLRRSERSMKPPRPHRSLNRRAVSPAFTALATRPVSASARIERRAASTTCGSASASYSRRHASSCAFNDIEQHPTSEAEHPVHFSFPLTCSTPLVVILSIPRENNDGPPRRDGSICPRR